MRTVPTLSNTITVGNYTIAVGAGAQTITSLVLTGAYNNTYDQVFLAWGSAGAWTAGYGCALVGNNTTNAFLDFSAEL
jgi:hypothetical protein